MFSLQSSVVGQRTKVLKVVQNGPKKREGVLQIISFVLLYGLRLHISQTAWSKKKGVGGIPNNSLFVIITWFMSTDIILRNRGY